MKIFECILAVVLLASAAFGADPGRPQTFCNPLDLEYRFSLGTPSREAADPTMVRFHNEYWLFASKSGGYWHSRDMLHWTFVQPTGLPLEDYAPTAEVIAGKLYFTAFDSHAIYTSDDPAAGAWKKVASIPGFGDPALFADDDGRVYVYYGCSPTEPLWVQELDPKNNFAVVGKPVACLRGDVEHRGWEIKRAENLAPPMGQPAWIEGAWMNKHAGKYYLQYAGPGTQFSTYGDGVCVADSPEGPFTYAPYSPFSHKATGFICGPGHSSTFQDNAGKYWHVTTLSISVRHMFERRLGLFPSGFIGDQLACNTYLGDYPQLTPGVAADALRDNSAGWMLLSLNKPVEASSELDAAHAAKNAVDENVRTWWSAKTGTAGEWLRIDLAKRCRMDAVQINFADEGAKQRGRLRNDAYRYVVEISDDGVQWTTAIDRHDNTRDAPHDYEPLEAPVLARYVRITNVHTPASMLFSLSGLRIFGSGLGQPSAMAHDLAATRNPKDKRSVHLTWSGVPTADFYIIRFGIAADRLMDNYQVYKAAGSDTTEYDINSLNTGVPYFFTLDTVNDTGVTKGTRVVSVP